MNGLDLFSGIGGITIALSPWVRPVAYCENDRYAQAVLLSRMASDDIPRAPIWDDVTSLRGAMLPSVDIIYGGSPCQDLSVAGNQEGLGGDRSGLFFQVMRLAEELKPSFIFLENVSGVRKFLGCIGWELASIGYDCRWLFIPANAVGAPHLRNRWFCLASHADRKALRIKQGGRDGKDGTTAAAFHPSDGNKGYSTKPCDWTIKPELFGVGNGIPFAVDRDRALGNAVVPLQAREAFKRLAGII